MLPGEEDEAEQFIFAMEEDENFEGLRPKREVGEQPHPGVSTGQNVMLQEVLVPSRQTTGGGRGRARNHALDRGALHCRVCGVRMNGRGRGRGGQNRDGFRAEAATRAEPASEVGSNDYNEDDWNEVDKLYSQNLAPEGESRRRRRAQSDADSGEQGRRRRVNGEGQSGIALESTFLGNSVGESCRDSMSSNSGSSGSAQVRGSLPSEFVSLFSLSHSLNLRRRHRNGEVVFICCRRLVNLKHAMNKIWFQCFGSVNCN